MNSERNAGIGTYLRTELFSLHYTGKQPTMMPDSIHKKRLVLLNHQPSACFLNRKIFTARRRSEPMPADRGLPVPSARILQASF